jgi:hypothetical protein
LQNLATTIGIPITVCHYPQERVNGTRLSTGYSRLLA